MTSQAATTDSQEAPVLLEALSDGILTLTLNRPKARNSLSDALIDALQSTFDRIAEDPQVRVVVIRAEGHVFSAGHDLKEMTAHRNDPDGGQAYFTDLMTRCSRMMQSIVMSPKPVIAQVDGIATAAGCQLVASCDLAVASSRAHFATPGVNIGLFCSTPMVALSRNVSRKAAMEMLLLGDMIDAQKALAIGLVNRVVAPEAVADEVRAMAEKIAAKSALTLAMGKAAFYKQLELPLSEAYDYATEVMVRNMMAADAEEGICAFLEKRPPRWTDS